MTKITRLCIVAIILIFNDVLAKTENTASFNSSSASSLSIQRVRIDFTMPNGYVRHLLLGFTSNNVATDGYDYGYDALNMDTFPDDLNWMIDDKRYVIQSVGAFEDTKAYPLGLFLKNSGNIKIALDRTENFDTPIDVFLYDSHLDTYTKLNEESFDDTMTKGDYLDRFYIAFKSDETITYTEDVTNQFANSSLSTDSQDIKNTKIAYLRNSNELFISTPESIQPTKLSVFSMTGQRVFTTTLNTISREIKIPLNTKLVYGIITVESDNGFVSKQMVLQ